VTGKGWEEEVAREKAGREKGGKARGAKEAEGKEEKGWEEEGRVLEVRETGEGGLVKAEEEVKDWVEKA
jgi:hypothetical protein